MMRLGAQELQGSCQDCPREQFLALAVRKSSPVLSWFMSFFNSRLAVELLGEENVPEDSRTVTVAFEFGASERADWDRKINYAKATGNFAIGIGRGACIPFGHGGPGEFAYRLLDRGENHVISLNETGVKREIRYNPHFYHHFDYPLNSPEYLGSLTLPDPDDPRRYKGIAEETEYYKQHGLVTYANVNGFFSGIHYFLYPYDKLLADLILEPDFVHGMLEKLGRFNLSAAENLLKCGVDMITFCDDLGSGNSLLMSPELYREYFLPWHRKLADLCHRYGALVHMHSHGNINKIIGDLYDAGIDLLNPNDPYEGMDLPALKKEYGDRITFVGGLDKYFFEWDYDTQKAFVKELAKKTGGGFILMDSGGVPENVTPERFKQVLEIFAQARSGCWE